MLPYRLTISALPVLYVDDVYNPSTVIEKANEVYNILNLCMNSDYIDIEHEFGLASSLFKRLSIKHTWKLLQKGGHVTEHLFSIFFYGKCINLCLRKKISAK